MPITRKPARQKKLSASADFTFTNVVSGAYEPAIDLPINAVVISGALFITTIFNSATTDVFSIGSQLGVATASAQAYAATSADVTVAGRAAVILPHGIKTLEASTVGVVWTGAGAAPTAGVGRLVVEYIIDGNEESTYDL